MPAKAYLYSMESTFAIWATNRSQYVALLKSLTLEQLNTTPQGFTNNIIWNAGHVLVSQQGLVYRASGLPVNVPAELVARYRTGTQPTEPATQEEVDQILSLLMEMIDLTKADYAAGKFTNYQAITTKTGFTLTNAEEAIAFNTYHEGLHLGTIMALKKLV